ncbi:MAG: flagellar biosynthesis protein FlgN [Treponema sp.]
MQTIALTESEIAERVAVLKRFRTLLEQQRLKFREYLTVLEKQETSITEAKVEALAQHAELGEAIVAEIFTIQKVLDPLEYLYANVCEPTAADDIPDLKNDLAVLQEQVIAQNKKNREFLSTQMTGLRQQIASLKRPYMHRESIYAASADPARFIDLSL